MLKRLWNHVNFRLDIKHNNNNKKVLHYFIIGRAGFTQKIVGFLLGTQSNYINSTTVIKYNFLVLLMSSSLHLMLLLLVLHFGDKMLTFNTQSLSI